MTTAGSVDLLSNKLVDDTIKKRYQYIFSRLYSFLSGTCGAKGYSELVANNYGTGGTGMTSHDEAAPCGDNAWAVFKWLESASTKRAHDLYIMIQAGMDVDTFGGAASGSIGWPAIGAGVPSSYGILGIQAAWSLDGSIPWRGTTNKNGLDSKGIPIWNTGSGGNDPTYVLPVSNNKKEIYSGSRHYYAQFVISSHSTDHVYHFVANEDFILAGSSYDVQTQLTQFAFVSTLSVINPLEANVSASMPIVMNSFGYAYDATAYGYPTLNTTIGGNYAAVSALFDGGTFVCSSTEHRPSPARFSYHTYINDVSLLYNGNVASGSIDLYEYIVYSYFYVHGLLGAVDHIYLCSKSSPTNINITGSLNGNEYAVFLAGPGTATTPPNWAIPWSGSAPRSGLHRDGRQW